LASLPAVLLVACSSPEDGAFRGAVRGPDGAPAAGCTLTVVPGRDVREPVPEFAALTGADGSYRYPLPAGTFEVTALCADGSATVTSTLAPGEETVLDLAVG
jgi:hypothetical protein